MTPALDEAVEELRLLAWCAARVSALDHLANARTYLRAQFHMQLPRFEAQALSDAMELLIATRLSVVEEAELALQQPMPKRANA